MSEIKKHINSGNVIFIKKVLQLPRDRRKWLFKKLIKQEDNDDDDDILFVKKIPLHPKNRMQQALKQQAEELKKKIPQHPRERRKCRLDKKYCYSKKFKRNELKLNDKEKILLAENSKKLKKNLYKFHLKTMLNKPQFFDLSQTTEYQIFDKIMECLPADNDEYYIQHSPGLAIFTVKREPRNGR